jgi:O-antigen/teichoic acid export membrane protein
LRRHLVRAQNLARRPATIYLVAGALARLGSIALVPLYSRKLTTEEYGIVALAQSFIGLSPVLSLGLATAMSRFFFDSKDPVVVKRNVGGVCLWAIFATVLVCSLLEGLVFLIAPPSTDTFFGRRALSYTLVAAGGSAIASIPPVYFRDSMRPLTTAFIQLFEFALTVGSGLLLVLFLRRGVEGALQSLAATYLVLATSSSCFVVFWLRGRPTLSLLRRALGFSLPYLPHFIALWLQGAADRSTMELVGQRSALGPYALASQLSTPGAIVSLAWNNDQAAVTGERYRDDGMRGVEGHLPSMRRSFLLASGIPSLATLLALPLLRVIVSAKYQSSFVYLPFLLLNVIVDSMYMAHSNVPYFASKGRAVSAISIASVGLNVAANIVLIPRIGVWGAIIARLLFTVTRTGATWYLARRCFREARRGSSTDVAVS